MKKISLILTALLVSALVLVGCGKADAPKTLKVGATAVPHAEILQIVKPILAKENVNLEIVEMSDYVTPNLAVADKELDANFFQHTPYLEKFCKERNINLVNIAGIHIEPMGIYSKKLKGINELGHNMEVAIPNDPTNGGRALMLLAKAGLITLKEGATTNATVADIVENSKHIKITELEAPQLPRALDDVALAVINTIYALEAGFVPTKDALAMEKGDSPYVNILVARAGDENREDLQKLVKALKSDEVKNFINEKYKGAVVPAF